jgi:hypothetical protein
MKLMLEVIFFGLARWLRIDWLFWDSDGGVIGTAVDEHRERIENAKWSKEFLAQKKAEQAERNARRSSGWRSASGKTQSSGSVRFGRPGSGGKP